MRRRLLLAPFFLVVVAACGGGSDPVAEPVSSQPASEPEPETVTAEPDTTSEETTREAAPPGVPGYVEGYRDWVKLNDEPIPPRDADPHLGTKNVYASQDRRPNGRFPYGTVVVKDATRPGKDFIGLIAVMRKERGADPAHGDWVFVEFTREARSDRFSLQARGAVCWTCHAGALDSDYVFTR